jgi:exonuclease III
MPLKQREVVKMVRRFKVSILCLVETRVKQENCLRIKAAMLPSWGLIHNYSSHQLGRIWVCWDPNVFSVMAVYINEQLITCRVSSASNNESWMLSTVYGATQGPDRRKLLQALSFAKGLTHGYPWLIGGDFNVIRSPHEKWGNVGFSCYELEFIECMHNLEIEDLVYTSCFHTWTNNQVRDAFVSKKLDRVLSNLLWLQQFGNSSVQFLERGVSDHSPCLVSIAKFVSYGPKPFKFF